MLIKILDGYGKEISSILGMGSPYVDVFALIVDLRWIITDLRGVYDKVACVATS